MTDILLFLGKQFFGVMSPLMMVQFSQGNHHWKGAFIRMNSIQNVSNYGELLTCNVHVYKSAIGSLQLNAVTSLILNQYTVLNSPA